MAASCDTAVRSIWTMGKVVNVLLIFIQINVIYSSTDNNIIGQRLTTICLHHCRHYLHSRKHKLLPYNVTEIPTNRVLQRASSLSRISSLPVFNNPHTVKVTIFTCFLSFNLSSLVANSTMFILDMEQRRL